MLATLVIGNVNLWPLFEFERSGNEIYVFEITMDISANCPKSKKPIPMVRIFVGNISETYKYMVVSQQVL
jgi:hypothetical protein